MAGIEKIKNEIMSEAHTTAESIINDAKLKADKIISDSETDAMAEVDEILKQSQSKALMVKTTAESACALDRKNRILGAKTELINLCFEKANEKLCNLKTDEYFDVLKRLAVYYSVLGEGKMVLSSKDKDNVPKDFIDSINSKLSAGKTISLSDETDDSINGGFIIKYKEIEINCKFDAIISGERERLIDAVNNELFN